jgi:hypothetical protein
MQKEIENGGALYVDTRWRSKLPAKLVASIQIYSLCGFPLGHACS